MGDMPLMTENGTFIVNGTERVIVSQMHRSPGVFFDHDKGKTHSSGKLLFAARIIPYRGSWLDVEFDAKDIVHVRIDRKRKLPVTSLLFALGLDGEEILSTFYNRVVYDRDGADWRVPYDAERLKGFKASVDLIDAESGEVVLEAGKKLNARNARQIAERGVQVPQGDRRGSDRPVHRRGPGQRQDRRDLGRGRRRDLRQAPEEPGRGRHLRAAAARHRPHQRRPLHPQHPRGGQELGPRRRAVRHLPGHASRRAADPRHRRGDVPLAVLRFRALRPLGRRPREDEHASRPRRRGHRADAPPGGHARGRQGAGGPARRQGRDRRHRSPRQPPGALGRRADGEPVPPRPAPHGARHQGADVLRRHRHGDAAGPHQREARGRGRARVLRLVAALAVHGPDQPALGSDAQAPPLGAWPGRSDPRARRLRGARRAPDPLRPHLPDRDAGRPEHRPDQLARHLRAGEQVRLHRDPVPAGEGRRRHHRGRLPLGDGGGEVLRRPGQRADGRELQADGGPRGLPSGRRRHRRGRRIASTSWTCRRSSSSRSPPR